MTTVVRDNVHAADSAGQAGLRITLGGLLMAVLVITVLVLRVISLEIPTMSHAEAAPALSAWRSVAPDAPGAPIQAESTALFWAQATAFATLGATEFAARILTALAGAALTLSPLLFRHLLGPVRAYAAVALLAFSPVMMASARFTEPAIWSGLFAVIGLWAVWRYLEGPPGSRQGPALLATVAFAALVLLAEPGGPLLALVLAGAGAAALSLSALDAPQQDDLPGDDYLAGVRARFADWPWTLGGMAAALVVFCVATGFLLYPSGVDIIGATLSGFLEGFTTRQPDYPALFPLLLTLFYETWLLLLALIAVVLMVWGRAWTFTDRFLLAWVLLAVAAVLVYPGARAGHALWLLLPVTLLAAEPVSRALVNSGVRGMWSPGGLAEEDPHVLASLHRWKWLLGLMALTLLFVAATHFQIASRGLLVATNGDLVDFFSRLNTAQFNDVTISLVWLLIALLFLVVGYFLATSIWGSVMPAYALLLGLVGFTLITSGGSAWNLVGSRANNPTEPWFVVGASQEADLMRQTLQEIAFRETQGFLAVPMAIYAPDDSLTAWLVRDFDTARFVTSIDDARTEQLVIMPRSLIEVAGEPGRYRDPDLGGSYLGQDFAVMLEWRASWLNGFQFLSWWSERPNDAALGSTLIDIQVREAMVVWVREDIYNSMPFDRALFEELSR
ncbi:MAG: hypothetical protein ACOCXR_00135 [Phototrophicaceae bacterium]